MTANDQALDPAAHAGDDAVEQRPRPDRETGASAPQCCFICQSRDIALHRSAVSFSIYRCAACNLLWVGEEVTTEELAAFYGEDYYESESEFGYLGLEYDRMEPLHRRNARALLKACEKIMPLRRRRVLDVGCGYGFFLHEARETFGAEVVGVEISQHAQTYARQTLGLDVTLGDLLDTDIATDSVDLVSMIGTIEHFVRPDLVVAEAARVLKPGGLLLVTTLDIRGPIRLYKLKPPEHLFYFDHDNCCRLLEGFGFDCQPPRFLFWRYDVLDIAVRLCDFFGLRRMRRPFLALQRKTGVVPALIPTNEMRIIARKR